MKQNNQTVTNCIKCGGELAINDSNPCSDCYMEEHAFD